MTPTIEDLIIRIRQHIDELRDDPDWMEDLDGELGDFEAILLTLEEVKNWQAEADGLLSNPRAYMNGIGPLHAFTAKVRDFELMRSINEDLH